MMWWALLFFVAALSVLVSLIGLFFSRFRRRASIALLISFAVVVVSAALIVNLADQQAQAIGFLDAADQRRAKEAGIVDPEQWTTVRGRLQEAERIAVVEAKTLPLSDEAARALATTALANVNAQCSNNLTIIDNPSALPNQHVLKVRCGDETNGKTYEVREAGATSVTTRTPPREAATPIQQSQAPAHEERTASDDVRSSILHVPRGPLDYIAAYCRDDWGTDYRMVEYCKNSQFEAVGKIKRIHGQVANDPIRSEVLYTCVAQWPKGDGYDWRMVHYCYTNQIEAYNRLTR